jgi:hypothetical protein
MGQNILAVAGTVLVLLLTLAIPLAAGALVFVAGRELYGGYTIFAAMLAAVLVLVGELAVVIGRLGRLLERTEPVDVQP